MRTFQQQGDIELTEDIQAFGKLSRVYVEIPALTKPGELNKHDGVETESPR